jgi:D-alanine-D-alanine ligase
MKHIVVLKGGWSAEREVSLNSGAACAKALRELGYRVSELDVGHDLAQKLAELKPDVVFNALHGNYGEDGCVQGLLELMGIPYTHSGVLASSLAMNKPMAKTIFEAAGLTCAKGITLTLSDLKGADPMPRPFVVKPACEGSSVGVYIVQKEDNRPLSMILEKETDTTRPYLVEQYIAGRELTVAVLNNRPLGVTEIRPISGFYDYENKYTDGKTEHLCPAPLPEAEYKKVMDMALTAHKALGCRGLSRSDFRYDGKDFYILETNTQPGMTRLSLSPELAAHAGINFNALVENLVSLATLDADHGKNHSNTAAKAIA